MQGRLDPRTFHVHGRRFMGRTGWLRHGVLCSRLVNRIGLSSYGRVANCVQDVRSQREDRLVSPRRAAGQSVHDRCCGQCGM